MPLSRVVAWSNVWLRHADRTVPAPHAVSRLQAMAQQLEGQADATRQLTAIDPSTPEPLKSAIDALEQEMAHAH